MTMQRQIEIFQTRFETCFNCTNDVIFSISSLAQFHPAEAAKFRARNICINRNRTLIGIASILFQFGDQNPHCRCNIKSEHSECA